MGVDPRQRAARRTRIVVIVLAGLLFTALIARVMVAVSGADRLTRSGVEPVDLVLFVVGLTSLITAGSFVYVRAARRRRYAAVRGLVPGATLISTSLIPARRQFIEDAGESNRHLNPPQGACVALTQNSVEVWVGVRPYRAASILTESIRYEVGTFPSPIGVPTRAIIARLRGAKGEVSLPLFPLAEDGWRPRLLDQDDLVELAESLNMASRG